jgi:hypothetical protein
LVCNRRESLPVCRQIVNRKEDVCGWRDFRYIVDMKWLTKQEQLVVCAVLGLLLTGLWVKYYRAAQPAGNPVASAKP